MIKAGIIGSTGYAGMELVRLLMQHPETEIVWYGSRSYVGKPYEDIYRNFFRFVEADCLDDDLDTLADEADVIFTATPQYLAEAVYGLPELYRERIRGARLVANPGCFPTCSILAVAPLIRAGLIDPDSVIIDAKSGTTGAGRGAKVQNLFCEVNETIKAYGVTVHRHTPEIEDQLSEAAGRPLLVQFTPHLVPMNRGILVTAYADAAAGADAATIRDALLGTYADEPFVRVLDEGVVPETRWVKGSNFADVGAMLDKRTGRVIMMGAIDNIGKGAAGQAVQNMNLLFGLPETTGLMSIPMPV